jgi:hypothetical protein
MTTDPGPQPSRLYHGSHDGLKVGDVLRPGHAVNHELSTGADVYTHPDPGMALTFAKDFHGRRATVYEVEAPGARPDMPEDTWNSQHLSRHAVVKRPLSADEVHRISSDLCERGLCS